jgi:hypothetical protein
MVGDKDKDIFKRRNISQSQPLMQWAGGASFCDAFAHGVVLRRARGWSSLDREGTSRGGGCAGRNR